MKILRKLGALALLLAVGLTADDTGAISYVPNTTTIIASKTVSVFYLSFDLVSGASTTITINDRSTNCSGTVCPVKILTLTTAAPNASGPLYGVTASGGLTWVASNANSVTGWLSYR